MLQGVTCRRRPSRRVPPGGRGGPRPDTTDVVSRRRRLHLEHVLLLEDTVKGACEHTSQHFSRATYWSVLALVVIANT